MKLFKFFLYITILMFTFLSKSNAKYEKNFYDFEIKSITGEKLELSDYKDKTVLLVNVASNCGFTKQYSPYKIYMKNIKIKIL